jgi:hypothetical protein
VLLKMAMVPVHSNGKLSRVVNLGVWWFLGSMVTSHLPALEEGPEETANQQSTSEVMWLGINGGRRPWAIC